MENTKVCYSYVYGAKNKVAKKNERKRKIDTWAAEKETACLNIAARERERGGM